MAQCLVAYEIYLFDEVKQGRMELCVHFSFKITNSFLTFSLRKTDFRNMNSIKLIINILNFHLYKILRNCLSQTYISAPQILFCYF